MYTKTTSSRTTRRNLELLRLEDRITPAAPPTVPQFLFDAYTGQYDSPYNQPMQPKTVLPGVYRPEASFYNPANNSQRRVEIAPVVATTTPSQTFSDTLDDNVHGERPSGNQGSV